MSAWKRALEFGAGVFASDREWNHKYDHARADVFLRRAYRGTSLAPLVLLSLSETPVVIAALGLTAIGTTVLICPLR